MPIRWAAYSFYFTVCSIFSGAGCSTKSDCRDEACAVSEADDSGTDSRWPQGDTQKDYIRFSMTRRNYGSQAAAVICETTDTGSLVIDGQIVSAILMYGADYVKLTRYRTGAVETEEGRVILRTMSTQACW